MNDNEWKYAEDKAHFDSAGDFTAWCAGSGKGSSAAAWRVERNDSDEAWETVRASDGPSTAPRSGLASAVGALESVQPRSKLLIYSTDQYVVDTINEGIQRWRANGWMGADGLVKNLDIISRIARVIAERELEVSAIRSAKASADGKVLERLKNLAKECWKRAA